MKLCRTCGRPKHSGLCDMVQLSNGRAVHVNRIAVGGDLHKDVDSGVLKIVNRWRKSLDDKKEKKEA